MSTTLPTLSRTIDNAFVTTWYEIREEAIDNILNATPVWAVLNNAGALTPQEGGTFITRTIAYGTTDAVAVADGDLLPEGEDELETMAIWEWRALATHVQRSIFQDQQNRGPSKIKSLVGTKLKAARDGLEQKYESSMFGAFQQTESSKEFQGLEDLVPSSLTNAAAGTYGKINRPTSYTTDSNDGSVLVPTAGNTWWGHKYLTNQLAGLSTTLLDDMRRLYNSLKNNQIAPNFILTTQAIFEEYEDQALSLSQIIKADGSQPADLGFEALLFKGKPIIWTDQMNANQVLFLNTDFMEVVYDPGYWFDMTDWKPAQLESKRIAHIISFANMITTQPRRHGRIIYS